MDLLSDDLLINIVARVVAHNMYDLFNFQRTNKRHAALCRDPTVSRAVFTDCIPLLTDLDLTPEKLVFMNRLWDHGNPMFCILMCSKHMLPRTLAQYGDCCQTLKLLTQIAPSTFTF